MYNKITDEELIGSKKQFNLTNGTKVCVKFEFSDIIGVHNISIVWFSPLGQILKIDEHAICSEENNEYNEYSIWSVLPLDNQIEEYPNKGWLVIFFVNRSFILEDEFEVHRSIMYSSLGKFK